MPVSIKLNERVGRKGERRKAGKREGGRNEGGRTKVGRRRKERRRDRKEGGWEGRKNNVNGDEFFKHYVIWWLRNSKREAVIPCFSDPKNALLSIWWKTGFSRSNLLQVSRFLSLGVTKFVKISLPSGLLNHDHWYRHPSPLLFTSAEAHFFYAPQKRTFTRPSVVIPSIFLRGLRLQSSTSSEGLSEGFTPAEPMPHVHL